MYHSSLPAVLDDLGSVRSTFLAQELLQYCTANGSARRLPLGDLFWYADPFGDVLYGTLFEHRRAYTQAELPWGMWAPCDTDI
jgi:hypothetical protein